MGCQVLAKLIGSITWRRSSSISTSSYCQKSLCRHYVAAPPPPPAVFVDKNTRVICQGITGWKGTMHTKQAIEWGTKMKSDVFETFKKFKATVKKECNLEIKAMRSDRGGEYTSKEFQEFCEVNGVASVTRQKGRTEHLGLPVFNTVVEAKAETKANASVIYASPPFAAAAIMEAMEAELDLVFCITEWIPPHDMARVKAALNRQSKTRLIGPNFIGIIKPGECTIGILNGVLHKPGCVGIVSRSHILTCEAAFRTSVVGLGQSTSVGIGRDPFNGKNFVDCIEKFLVDPETKGIILVGERSGTAEEDAAALIKESGTEKPIIGFIAPSRPYHRMYRAGGSVNIMFDRTGWGRRMGHVGGGKGTVQDKIKTLKEAGVTMVESPENFGVTMLDLFKQRGLVNHIHE